VGAILDFTVICNLDLPFHDIGTANGTGLEDCADQCSMHRPRCGGVVWEAFPDRATGICWFKDGSASPDGLQQTDSRTDVILPATDYSSTNDCGALNANYTSSTSTGGKEFVTRCGLDYPYNDIAPQVHARSLADCIDQCAGYVGSVECLGVSYEARQTNGLLNCFMKSGYSEAKLQIQQDVDMDSAFLKRVIDPNFKQAETPGGGPTGSSVGAIVGGVVGGVTFLGLFILGVVLLRRKRKSIGLLHGQQGPVQTLQISRLYDKQLHQAYSDDQNSIPNAPTELDGIHRPAELKEERQDRVELEGRVL
jgi:hypothetical protein